MSKEKDYVIPTLLSDYVDNLEDWEIVEYVSRHEITSKYLINGASEAMHKEMLRVWRNRYPEEPIPIIECVPPLDCEINFLNECRQARIEDE